MKKLISFSVFVTLLLVVLLIKTSQAQVMVVNTRTAITTPARDWVNGYWKWNSRGKRYVWVEGNRTHRPYARRSKRLHVISYAVS